MAGRGLSFVAGAAIAARRRGGIRRPAGPGGAGVSGWLALPVLLWWPLWPLALAGAVAVEVVPGDTADPATVPPLIEKLRGRFDLADVVLVSAVRDGAELRGYRLSPGRAAAEFAAAHALRSGSGGR